MSKKEPNKKKPAKKSDKKPEVHEELQGFDIHINEFGEIVSNYNMDKINDFLNENVDDKKLRERKEGDKSDQNQEEE